MGPQRFVLKQMLIADGDKPFNGFVAKRLQWWLQGSIRQQPSEDFHELAAGLVAKLAVASPKLPAHVCASFLKSVSNA